jgi:phosphatidylinositol glycan class O
VAALIPLWRNRPYKRPQDLVTRAAKSSLVYAIYMSVVSLASAVMAYVLRRHLMVWKIFAPRYMLGGLSILVVDFMMVVAVWASGHTVSRVSELFA